MDEAPASYIFADVALSRRLEKAEALGNVAFVEARARAFPDSGAEWTEVAGAYAMFDGIGSPLTQTFALGIFEPAAPADLERIERFFIERGASVFHEVSPLADPSLLPLLNTRGYHPCERTSVMSRPIHGSRPPAAAANDRITVRRVRSDEHELWARIAARGWSGSPELGDFMLSLAAINAARAGAVSFLAELDGEPMATGALGVADGVALLAGASTVPEGRKQGAQLALLDARLRYAVEQGCDIAMMCALPGSASQRNAERQGFRIAYTRIKWRLGLP